MNSDASFERYSLRERLCHWLAGFTYLYCLGTGLAFYTPYLFWIAIALGGGATSRFWHPFAGVAFFATVMWMHGMWRADMALSLEDRKWLDNAREYAANRDHLVPPQGRYNAGQKVFYWAMFWGVIALLITGVAMWFPDYVPATLRWVRPLVVILHSAAALITIGAFIIHIYMGLFLVPGSLAAMVRGGVSKDWARAHHRLWYEHMTRRPE